MRALLLLMLLSACSARELPEVKIPLRNPTAPVASQVDASLARLEGRWVVVEAAELAPGSTLEFRRGTLVLGGVALPVSDEGAGRFTVAGETLWVHWLDADNRTAALGDPGGRRAWILDRSGAPGERLRAAREILAWYGYDLERLAGR